MVLGARIKARWSLQADAIYVDGSRLILQGVENACDGTAFNHGFAAIGQSLRLWQSGDAGVTWQPVDLAAAEPVLHTPEPVPTSASGCPKASDYQAFTTRFGTTGSIRGVMDGRVVAQSEDGTRTATSADLTSWTVADVPGILPSADVDGVVRSHAAASLLTAGPDGWTLRSLQRRRDDTGAATLVGCQVRWWRSVDHGVSWTAGDLGRPIRVCDGGFYTFRARADGSVLLFSNPAPVTPGPLIGAYVTSVAGPLRDWSACAPGPAAACDFAALVAPGSPGADWHKIQLFGAVLTKASLTGADLSAADLYGAVLDGDLSRTDLHDAELYRASITGTLAGADLAGAFLDKATIDADMTGADFTGASVYGTTFHGDLTGASFRVASTYDVTFLAGTICPDGKPASSAKGKVACRLP